MLTDVVRKKIDRKIYGINQQKTIDKIRNVVPENIESMIGELSRGTLDIQTANQIINQEAKTRVESRPQTKFTLTEQQERTQILIKIKTILVEQSEQYKIENPEKTIEQLQQLCGDGLEQSIGTVVRNLINSKEFQRARETYDKFSKKDKTPEFQMSMKLLRNNIRNAEISYTVLKLINMNGTVDEEQKYLDVIENGLDVGNVKLNTISLGKSQDGKRNITLADVWEDKKLEREK